MKNEDGRNVSFLLADINHNTAEAVCGIELGYRGIGNPEPGDIERLEKDPTCTFVAAPLKASKCREEDWGLILDVSLLELVEEDVLPWWGQACKRRLVGRAARTILLLLVSNRTRLRLRRARKL